MGLCAPGARRIVAAQSRDSSKDALPFNPVWIVFGLSALGSIIAIIMWSHDRGRSPDLGFVSHQWLMEHRMSQGHDQER